MLFILGNAYQGLITSFMIFGDKPVKFNSIDELFASDYKISATAIAYKYLILHVNLLNRIQKITNTRFGQANLTDLYTDQTAVIISCDVVKSVKRFDDVADNFYIMDQKIFPYYAQLHVGHMSKFLKKWQLLMDWSFEAGLPKIWEIFLRELRTVQKSTPDDENPPDWLELDDIDVAFYALLVGILMGALALVCEIFWHDCVDGYLRRRRAIIARRNEKSLKEIQERKFRFLRKRRVKVRRIQVQPVETAM
jgi:hypothetical protein